MEPEHEIEDVIALSQALREKRLTRIEKSRTLMESRKKKNLEGQKYDELPNLIPKNFKEFLDKYPICNEIYSGQRLGFTLNKENLIKKILEFFEDQGITEYDFKKCLKNYKGGDILEFLNGLDISELRVIPRAIYKYDKPILAELKSRKKKTLRRNTKQRKKKQTRKKRVQKGGFAPCIPCLASPAAFASAAIGGASFMMKSSSSKSSISNINGRKLSVKRNEKYKTTKDGKTHKREFKQMNKRVYDGKKMSEYDTIKQASEAYNSLIKRCKSKGFQKC